MSGLTLAQQRIRELAAERDAREAEAASVNEAPAES